MYLIRLRVKDFVSTSGTIWQELRERFANVFGYRPSQSEIESWRQSLPELAIALSSLAAPLQQCLVYLEFTMPSSSARADVVIVGLTADGQRAAIIVELKQWEAGSVMVIGHNVRVGLQDHSHPCEQALGYRDYLVDLHTAFSDLPCVIRSCAYLHESDSQTSRHLVRAPFEKLIEVSPLFTRNERDKMGRWISSILAEGPDSRYIAELDCDTPKVSRSLFATVAKAVRDEPAWKLLDEQRTVFNTILDLSTNNDGEKHLVLVIGGPGTGKSVIATQLLGELHRRQVPAVHVTNSSSFTTVMKALVGRKRDSWWGTRLLKGYSVCPTVGSSAKIISKLQFVTRPTGFGGQPLFSGLKAHNPRRNRSWKMSM